MTTRDPRDAVKAPGGMVHLKGPGRHMNTSVYPEKQATGWRDRRSLCRRHYRRSSRIRPYVRVVMGEAA
ncbi:hypothetical protein GCM10009800_38330 [Nocardiopsis rhodophaea]